MTVLAYDCILKHLQKTIARYKFRTNVLRDRTKAHWFRRNSGRVTEAHDNCPQASIDCKVFSQKKGPVDAIDFGACSGMGRFLG